MIHNIVYPKQLRNAKIPIDHNKCFVIMPFNQALNGIYGYIKDVLNSNGYVCTRADEIAGSKAIINKILIEIAKSQYVIADLTGLNPNVFYELGIAHAVKDNQNVIIIKQKQDTTPVDISHLTYIEYDADNLMLLSSKIIKFIEETKYISDFHRALNRREIISIIHDNKDDFIDYLQDKLDTKLHVVNCILNSQTKNLSDSEIIYVLNTMKDIINELILSGDLVLLSGILKIYAELIALAPIPVITDKLAVEFLSTFWSSYNLNPVDIISWQSDLALTLAEKEVKVNIAMPWIIDYFSRTKSTTVDLNRYKLERFLLLSQSALVNDIIKDAIFSKNCYVREHIADIIGEKKLLSGADALLRRLVIEDNYFTAISIIRAIGKLQVKSGIDVINGWVSSNYKQIKQTQQFFTLKHARIAIAELDDSMKNHHLSDFDAMYGHHLTDYFIL